MHIFEVGPLPDATGVVLRYGACLAHTWRPKLADINLVPITTLSGGGATVSDLGAAIRGSDGSETRGCRRARCNDWKACQSGTAYVEIWSH